jgi:bisphosphoglycerate-dependent phosphoglycerate mutase
VLIVTHGEILRLLTGPLLGLNEEEIIHFPVIANAIPLVFDLRDDFTISTHYYLDNVRAPV